MWGTVPSSVDVGHQPSYRQKLFDGCACQVFYHSDILGDSYVVVAIVGIDNGVAEDVRNGTPSAVVQIFRNVGVGLYNFLNPFALQT